MNQSRLNNYKEECYNVGSPRPDPVRRMSDYFPRRQSSSQTSQSSSQTSQIPQLSRKRSIRDIDTEDSPQAPKKMRPEEIDAMKTLIQEAMAGQNEKLEKLDRMPTKEDLSAQVKAVVVEEVGKVRDELELERTERRNLGAAIDNLTADVNRLKDNPPHCRHRGAEGGTTASAED